MLAYVEAWQAQDAFITDRSETDRVYFFLNGLKPELYSITTRNGMPTTLQEAIKLATLADYEYVRRLKHARQQVFRPSSSTSRPQRSPGPEPMELGNLYSTLDDNGYELDDNASDNMQPSNETADYMDAGAGAGGNTDNMASVVSAAVTAALNALNVGKPRGRPGSRAPTRRFPKLTPAEKTECIDKKLCFICKQAGHQWQACPKGAKGANNK